MDAISINDAKDGSFVRDAELWVESMGGTPPKESVFPSMYAGMLDDYADADFGEG